MEKRSDGYFIAGIAEKSGKPTVAAVRVGDKLIQVDNVLLSRCNARGYICRIAWQTWERSNTGIRKGWSAVNPASKGNCFLRGGKKGRVERACCPNGLFERKVVRKAAAIC